MDRYSNEYNAIHKWINSKLGRAKMCVNCRQPAPPDKKRWFQWANISHEYKRDFADWEQLCMPCHKRKDIDRLRGGVCKNGHQLTESNIFRYRNNPNSRCCLECRRNAVRRYLQKKAVLT